MVVTTPELDRDVLAYLRALAGKRRRLPLGFEGELGGYAHALYEDGLRYWGRLWPIRVAQLHARRVLIGARMRGRIAPPGPHRS
jgi:hypothetical protein